MDSDTGTNVELLTGSAGSGKTARLLREYVASLHSAIQGGGWPRQFWICPTTRSAGAVRQRLQAAASGCLFEPGVVTFAGLAETVVRQSQEDIRPISRSHRRYLLRSVIDTLQREHGLKSLGPVAGSHGFVDLVETLVSDFKRLEIWPAELRRGLELQPGTPANLRHRELALIYDRYQTILLQGQLYDEEGRFWAARRLLNSAPPAAFRDLGLVVVDGFTDFTRTQHEILSYLAAAANRLVISLPLEGELLDEPTAESARSGLFAKPLATWHELRRRHPTLTLQPHAPDPAVWPVTRFLATNLFRGPHRQDEIPAEVVDAAPHFRVVATAGASEEIREVARRVKRLIVDNGVSAAAIAVVDRNLAGRASSFVDAFEEFGIPYDLAVASSLGDAAWARSLDAVLRLSEEDWPFATVLDVVTDLRICPRACPAVPRDGGATSATRVAAERVVRELQIAQGRDELLKQLQRLAAWSETRGAAGGDVAAEAWSQSEQTSDLATKALPFFRAIADLLDALPRRATIAEWTERLSGAVQDLGLVSAAWPDTPDTAARSDRRVWERLRLALLQFAPIEAATGGPRVLRRQEFFTTVRDVFRSSLAWQQKDDAGGVQLLSAAAFRAVRAEHLFVTGLTEPSFSANEPAGLFAEGDYQRLAEAGTPLLHRVPRRYEEMLLFYETVTGSDASLTLSYAALDDRGQTIPKSPMLQEVIDLCEQTTAAATSTGQSVPTTETLLDRGPVNTAAPSSPAEWRIRGVAEALLGNGDRKSRSEQELAAYFAATGDAGREVPRRWPPHSPGTKFGDRLRLGGWYVHNSAGSLTSGGSIRARTRLQRQSTGTLRGLPLSISAGIRTAAATSRRIGDPAGCPRHGSADAPTAGGVSSPARRTTRPAGPPRRSRQAGVSDPASGRRRRAPPPPG